MNSTPPFVAQERPDSCAIACLRMILAYQGRRIEETEVIQATDLQEGGLTPEGLRSLQPDARRVFEDEITPLPDVSYVRFNIFPDGGVARLRLFGRPFDSAQGRPFGGAQDKSA